MRPATHQPQTKNNKPDAREIVARPKRRRKRKPRKPPPPLNMRAQLGLILPPTREEVMAARSPRGGWTRVQLAEWGIEWPAPRGWINWLDYRRATIERKVAAQGRTLKPRG